LLVYRASDSLIYGLAPAGWGQWAMEFGILSYALALLVPFVPGVELCIALMLVFGRLGVVLVYFRTLLGLYIAFQAGRRLPPPSPAWALRSGGFALWSYATESCRWRRARDGVRSASCERWPQGGWAYGLGATSTCCWR